MKTVKELLSQQWIKRNGEVDQGMVDHCLKSSIYADMGTYYLDICSKPRIDSTLYYADIDYSTGEMAKDIGKEFHTFKNYNMRMNSNRKWLEKLVEDNYEVVIFTQYTNDKTDGLIKHWSNRRSYEALETDQKATQEEKEKIIQVLKEQDKKYEKRLAAYYKRYADKISTSSYWADR